MNELKGIGHLNCPTHNMIYSVFELSATLMENWRGGGREGGRKGGEG